MADQEQQAGTGNTRKRLDATEWAKIRAAWESGEGTFKELSALYGTSEQTIKHRSSRESWQAGALKDAVREKVEAGTVSMLAELRMPKRRFLELLVERAEKSQTVKNIKRPVTAPDGTIITIMGKPVVADETVPVIDNAVQLQYVELLARVAGWLAPLVKPQDPPGNPEDEDIPVVSHMTPNPAKEAPANVA